MGEIWEIRAPSFEILSGYSKASLSHLDGDSCTHDKKQEPKSNIFHLRIH